MRDTTTINVRGVNKSVWNEATRQASLSRELAGPWLNDAIEQKLRRLAGAVVDDPAAMTVDQITARIAALAELAKGIAALKSAGSRAVGVGVLSRGLTMLLIDPRSVLISKDAVKNPSRNEDFGEEPATDTIDVEPDLVESELRA
jgi:hypothetical protein